MADAYFNRQHKAELRRIFTELSDLIHERGITRVIGGGPSATFYARALKRAYRNRHGGELRVVNLGRNGERFKRFANTPENAREILNAGRVKPIDLTEKSLVLEEASRTGQGLERIGNIFKWVLNADVATAVIAAKEAGIISKHDYVGVKARTPNQLSFFHQVYLMRGRQFETDSPGVIRRPGDYWMELKPKIVAELRQVADSVPKADKK